MVILGTIGGLLGAVMCSSKLVQDRVQSARIDLGHQLSDRFPRNHDAPRAVVEAAALALEKLAKSETKTYDVSSSMQDIRALQDFSRRLHKWTKKLRKATNSELETDSIQTLLAGVSSAINPSGEGEVSHASLASAREAAISSMREALIEETNPPTAFLKRFDGEGENRSFFDAFAEYIAVGLKENDAFRAIFETEQLVALGSGITELLGFERRRKADQAKDAGIEWVDDILYTAGVSKNRPSGMVLAKHRLVPFLDFDGRLDDLLRWANSGERQTSQAERSVAGRLYVGDGGVGKTRLSIELADILDERGWEVARISLEANANAIWRSLEGRTQPRGILVVIDYAECKQKSVIAIAKEAEKLSQKPGPPIRVLLLSRTTHGWWDDLRSHDGMDIFSPMPVNIGQGHARLDQEQRDTVFKCAVNEFRPVLKQFKLAEGKTQTADLSEERFGSPISISFAAYLCARGVKVSPDINLIEEMLSEERKGWNRYLKSRGCHNVSSHMTAIERGIMQVALFQGLSKNVAQKLLSGDTYFGNRSAADIDQVLTDLRTFYPHPSSDANSIGSLEPDILGEALIARQFSDSSEKDLLQETLIASSNMDSFPSLYPLSQEVIVRTASQHPEQKSQELMAELIARLAKAAENGKFQESAIRTIHANLPHQSTALMVFALRVQEKLLEFAKSDRQRASGLNNIGNRLSALGNLEEALTATQESVEIYRTLAEKYPDASKLSLAMSLNNMGNRHEALGNLEEALTATQEGVEIFRALAEENPDAFNLDLARSLTNMGNRHSGLGNLEEALKATQEGVEILRALAEKNPDAFKPNLASSLNNLGSDHSALGNLEEALTAAQEGVEIFRAVAEKNPDAFKPSLAKSLNNMGTRHEALGNLEEALTATQESVEIRSALAEKNPDAFNLDLANSLNNMGNRHSALGNLEEALTANQEAVDLILELAEKNPNAFKPDLASNLNNIGNSHSALGNLEEALTTTQESVEIYRALAEENPDAFKPGLAMSLNNMGNLHSALGNLEEALTATQESVEIYRNLAEKYPDAFIHDLANSLLILGDFYSANQQKTLAMKVALEAAVTLRPYFERRSEKFENLSFKNLALLIRTNVAAGKTELEISSMLKELGLTDNEAKEIQERAKPKRAPLTAQ